MDGKPDPQKGAKTFSCPACGGTITLRNAGQSLLAICSSCSSAIDVADENYKIISKANEKERKTLLAIGARGTFFEKVWEVLGYTQKSDSTGEYVWDEYLLFNPYEGYRFLVQSQGHWSFVTMEKEKSPDRVGAREYWFGDQKYRLFLQDTSVVQYVKGEFYWRVKKGDRIKEADYVAPPYFLAIEGSGNDVVTSQGLYVAPDVIRGAFNLGLFDMPRRKGVAMNQPSPYQGKVGKIIGSFIVFFFIAVAIQGKTSITSDRQPLYSNSYVYPRGQKDLTFASPSFTISKKSNVLVTTVAGVDNNWVEVNYSLVKEEGGDTSAGFSATATNGPLVETSSIPAQLQPQLQPGWVPCAAENGYCAFQGTRLVRFGDGNHFVYGTFSNMVLCAPSTFISDPAPGLIKLCSYQTMGLQAVPPAPAAAVPAPTPAPASSARPQVAYEMLVPVEYYHGYDSDGYWSEGGQTSQDYIASAVPPGTYRLLYDIDAGAFAGSANAGPFTTMAGQVQMSYSVVRDVPSTGNFWWTVLLLLIYPLLVYWRYSSFEAARWSQSDFAS